MKRLFIALVLPAALLLAASSASAHDDGVVGAAYSITNSAAGNQLVVYSRSADGSLAPAGVVATGGLGTGAGLASQGAVTLTKDGHRSSPSTPARTASRRSASATTGRSC